MLWAMKTQTFTKVLPKALRTLPSCPHSGVAANIFGTSHSSENFSKVGFLGPLITPRKRLLLLDFQKAYDICSPGPLLLYFHKQAKHASEGVLLALEDLYPQTESLYIDLKSASL